MSRNYNKVTLIGNVGAKSPELRNTKDNTPVTNFALATTETRLTAGGFKSITQWHRIVCWGDVAKKASKTVGSGDLVLIEGTLVYTKDDNGIIVAEVKALNTQVLEDKDRKKKIEENVNQDN